MQDSAVIIIGTGIGGLSAAIRLAAAGQEVIIFEQNAEPGGKMSRLQAEGFTWDRGPSVINIRSWKDPPKNSIRIWMFFSN